MSRPAQVRYAFSSVSKILRKKLDNKEYRDVYLDEHIRLFIAKQVRVLREQRGWTQKELARLTNKPQSVISRLEDPEYGRFSVATLLKLRSVFDVGLEVKFVEYCHSLNFYRNAGEEDAKVLSYRDEIRLSNQSVYFFVHGQTSNIDADRVNQTHANYVTNAATASTAGAQAKSQVKMLTVNHVDGSGTSYATPNIAKTLSTSDNRALYQKKSA